MAEEARIIALATACDDLQAQLEAGDRSVRHLDDDLTDLGALLSSMVAHTTTLTAVLQHMMELRVNMLEQRKALREVRAAAAALSASVGKTRESISKLVENTRRRDNAR